MTILMRAEDGRSLPLDVDRWRDAPNRDELAFLAGFAEPLLDIGCGPGRVPAALAAAGRLTLGIDMAPAAVAESAQRGAPVLRRDVFARLPGEGRWGTTLLLDGNIGIGGDPVALLRRCGELLRPGGQVVAELASPGQPTSSLRVRIEHELDAGPWFDWATVGVDDWAQIVCEAGLTPAGTEPADHRWFACATAP